MSTKNETKRETAKESSIEKPEIIIRKYKGNRYEA